MERNCHDAKPPNGFSRIVNQRETDAFEDYYLTKYQYLDPVGKQGQGLWRPGFKCTSILDAVNLPHDL